MLAPLVLSAFLAAVPAPEVGLNGNIPLKLTSDEQAALDELKKVGVGLLDDEDTLPRGTSVGRLNDREYPVPTDQDLKPLGRLKRLRNLELYGAPVGDATLDAVSGMADLQAINLSYTKVTDQGLKKLAGLKKLTEIILDGTRVTNASLKTLAECPAVKYLSLNETRVDDEGLPALETSDRLIILSVGENMGITDAGLSSLGKIPNLESLAITKCGVTDKGLEKMATPGAFPKLKSVSLYGSLITENGLKKLQDPHVLPGLKALVLLQSAVSAASVDALRKARPGLQIDVVP